MKFSIIIAFRDRELLRVENCLNSLVQQKYQDFEIILIDQGSTKFLSEQLIVLVNRYEKTSYNFNNTRGLYWNKSNALNIGIKKAKGEFVIIADVDLIFPEYFLETILQKVTDSNFITFNALYLPEYQNPQTLLLKNFQNKFYSGFIGLCVIPLKTIIEIRGYDEFYQIWGCEDEDIIKRLISAGLTRVHLLNDIIPIYHQWHISIAPIHPSNWYLEMVHYLFYNESIQRNIHHWGIQINESNRPIYSIMDTNSFDVKHQMNDTTSLYVYNDFIKKFNNKSNKSGVLKVKRHTVNKSLHFLRLFTKTAKVNDNDEKLLGFLEWFINKNMNLINDYYLHIDNQFITLSYLKN